MEKTNSIKVKDLAGFERFFIENFSRHYSLREDLNLSKSAKVEVIQELLECWLIYEEIIEDLKPKENARALNHFEAYKLFQDLYRSGSHMYRTADGLAPVPENYGKPIPVDDFRVKSTDGAFDIEKNFSQGEKAGPRKKKEDIKSILKETEDKRIFTSVPEFKVNDLTIHLTSFEPHNRTLLSIWNMYFLQKKRLNEPIGVIDYTFNQIKKKSSTTKKNLEELGLVEGIEQNMKYVKTTGLSLSGRPKYITLTEKAITLILEKASPKK